MVHGPNGFLRAFKGTVATSGPEVEVADKRAEGLRLQLRNASSHSVSLSVADAYHKQPTRTYQLRANAHVSVTVGIDSTNNWYDVSVTSAQDPAFLRRLAGHVETGRPSTSDPALG